MREKKGARDLPERLLTVRAALKRALTERFFTAHELSGRVGVSEKDIAGHLEHLARSVKGSGGRFEIQPARCHDCGFVFRDRTRLGKPSRCPRCKAEGLAPARFRIAGH